MRPTIAPTIVAAVAAAAAGFAAGSGWQAEPAGAVAQDVNTPVLRDIRAELRSLNTAVGRTPGTGMRDDVDDAKELLEQIERNTRRR